MEIRNLQIQGLRGRLIHRAGGNGRDARNRLGMLEGAVSLFVNLALVTVKGTAAWFSGSIGLLADALNNAGDMLSSLIVLFSFRLASKPRDRKHPYGHGRIETVGGLALSLILIVAGIEAGRSGLGRILTPRPVTAGLSVYGVIVLAVAAKWWLFRFARTVARVMDSEAMGAEAWNNFFDILSTSLVFAGLLGARLGAPALDGWAGVGVSLFIIYTGLRYGKTMVDTLLGRPPSEDDLRGIRSAARSVEGVRDAHDIIVHDYGQTRLISCHIDVDASRSALEVHRLAEQAEDAVAAAYDAKVIIHADPIDRSHPAYGRMETAVRNLVRNDPELEDYHDLRVQGGDDRMAAAVDFVTRRDVVPEQYPAKAERLGEALFTCESGLRSVEIGLESDYASDPEFHRKIRREKK